MPISNEPLWWLDLPKELGAAAMLPRCTDVLVVGSGYSGLSAALTLVQAGRTVAVVESDRAGFGASTRNAGFLGYELKPGLLGLAQRCGDQTAARLASEAYAAYRYTFELIEREAIRCDLVRNGRMVVAHTQNRLDSLVAELSARKSLLGTEFRQLPCDEIPDGNFKRTSIGACLVEEAATLQPALYHYGLLALVKKLGGEIIENTRVTAVKPGARNGFEVETSRGRVTAQDVVVATNGYTGTEFPLLRRCVIPVGSYMIATEKLPTTLVTEILPVGRSFLDTRRIMTYARTTPDGHRIIFGGRPSPLEISPDLAAQHFGRVLSSAFPALAGAKVAFSWSGLTSFTNDGLPHIGVIDGIHYAVGYQGSGISLASYLGHKVALRVLGSDEGETPFADQAISPFPLHYLKAAVVPTIVTYYRTLDRLGH